MISDNNNAMYIAFNGACVAGALFLLGLSIWMAPVDISTKGYWGMGIVFLAGSLVNLVKYRMDDRIARESLNRLEAARNEKIIKDYVGTN